MRPKQWAKFNSLQLPLTHLQDNTDIVNTSSPLVAAINKAKAYVDGILFHNEVTTAKSGGARDGKAADQVAVTDLAFIVAAAISSWAGTRGDEELKEAMNFSRSELAHGSDKDVTERCKLIKTRAGELKDQLAADGFSSALLDSFLQAEAQFSISVNRPRELTVEKKEARAMVNRLLKEGGDFFKDHLDKLMAPYRLTDRSFHDLYFLKRMIINPPTRHTALAGQVTDKQTGEPLDGVIITVEGTQLITQSEDGGAYNLRVPRFGDVSVGISKAGYKDLVKPVRIVRGEVTEENFQLEKM